MDMGASDNKTLQVCIVGELSLGFTRDILLGVAAFAHDHRMVQHRAHEFHPGLSGSWLDGLIVLARSPATARAVQQTGIPAVNVGCLIDCHRDVPVVCSNELMVGAAAAEEFIRGGFQHFAYGGWPGDGYLRNRIRGFQDRVAQAGCNVLFPSGEWFQEGRTDWFRWLLGLPKPIGILASNDDDGWRCSQTCRAAGLRVPQDVAIIGVDNDETLCLSCYPHLTSVQLPTKRIGYEAAALLLRLIEGENPPARPTLIDPIGIVRRGSSDVLLYDDDAVSSALQYILDNARHAIDVQAVVKSGCVSRRTLERRILRATGKTLLHHISRAKVDRAKDLLINSDLDVRQVARSCGFETASHFCAMFRKLTDQTPGGFRRRSRAVPD